MQHQQVKKQDKKKPIIIKKREQKAKQQSQVPKSVLSPKPQKRTFTGKSAEQVQKAIRNFYDQEKFSDDILDDLDFQIDSFQENGLLHKQIKIASFNGRKGSLYEGKRFKIKLQFDDDFPISKPKSYIMPLKNGKIFSHVNVYNDDGQICHPLIYRKDRIPLGQILKGFQEIIYNPNFNDSAFEPLAQKYKSKNSEYRKIMQDQKDELSDVQ